tara:strand:- start:586 stop:1239 length:654 start_codon:yes stop_codon:yes gene_type:complete
MSDIEGKKPQAFKRYAIKKKLGFLAVEYHGHGKSSGKFVEGNISKWTSDARIAIKKIVKKNDFIFIGSSMGAWISLNLFNDFKNQIRGFIGIGAAPEFVNRIMWKKFDKKIKQEILKKGICNVKHGGYEYPITRQFIKDGLKNKILSKKNSIRTKVIMIHGEKDEVVPVSFSRKVLALFSNAKKKLVIVKNGDHSLSNKSPLKKIINELNNVVVDMV